MTYLLSSKQYNLYTGYSQGLQDQAGQIKMKSELVRIHHKEYQDDLPFWLSIVENLDPILEVGCGHGRVTLPLLIAGHEVTGVDIDLLAIQHLRRSLEDEKRELQNRARIVHLDISDFHPGQLFGAVIIPCNTYSTFPQGKRRAMVSAIFHMLKPGGVLGASMPNPIKVERFHAELKENEEEVGSELETTITHPETGFPVQVSSSLKARKDRLVWDWIYDHLLPDGKVHREIQSAEHYLTNLDQYLKELKDSGFEQIRPLGDYDGSLFNEDSPYLILVGHK